MYAVKYSQKLTALALILFKLEGTQTVVYTWTDKGKLICLPPQSSAGIKRKMLQCVQQYACIYSFKQIQ